MCGLQIASRWLVICTSIYIEIDETEDPIPSSSDDDNSDSLDSIDIQLTEPVNLSRPTDKKHPFDVFNVDNHVWIRQSTTGLDGEDDEFNIPNVGNGSTLTYHSGTNSLYLYGGWNDERFSSDICKISADNWVWEKVKLTSQIQPTPRYLTAVVPHGDKICNFAGVSPLIVDHDVDVKFFYYEAHGRQYAFGWNNEYYEYDIKSRSWTAPLSGKNAKRPPPCGGHVMSKFDPYWTVYYGGRRKTGYTDEAYIFDLDKKEFQGPIKNPGKADTPWSDRRTFSTFISLMDPELVGQHPGGHGPLLKPKLLLMWGKRTERIITDEVWLLDPLSFVWTKLGMGDLQPRTWHIAQPFYCHMHSTECHVVIFGGNVHKDVSQCSGDRVNTADLKILTFGVPSLQNFCISAATTTQDPFTYSHSSVPPFLWQQVTSAYEAQKKHKFIHPKLWSCEQKWLLELYVLSTLSQSILLCLCFMHLSSDDNETSDQERMSRRRSV